ncbi:MAG: pantoate--beta-alanine ligase [Solirubrobacteraceae bacterium]
MITLRTIAGVRDALAQSRRAGARIGLVPTMGAFHEGHLSLMARARADCDVVVVSLFVNAPQFNDQADLAAYPRDEARDTELATAIGVDYLFAPAPELMYPPGFATSVSIDVPVDRLEGRRRGRAHFDGVVTIVTKLFNIVGPEVAYFGQKDAQQAHVIRRLVRDLDIPVRIEVCPIVREPDGLAMSSRNTRLSKTERTRATALHRALMALASSVAGGERNPDVAIASARVELDRDGVQIEYFELVDAETLAPVELIDGSVLALVAAQMGNTHLIDNELLSTVTAAGSTNIGSA